MFSTAALEEPFTAAEWVFMGLDRGAREEVPLEGHVVDEVYL
jgi:hypothetical protein